MQHRKWNQTLSDYKRNLGSMKTKEATKNRSTQIFFPGLEWHFLFIITEYHLD